MSLREVPGDDPEVGGKRGAVGDEPEWRQQEMSLKSNQTWH